MNTVVMRVRTVWIGFVALNLAWASAVYFSPRREVLVAAVKPAGPAVAVAVAKTNPIPEVTAPKLTNPPPVVVVVTNSAPRPETAATTRTNQWQAAPGGKKFTGQDVPSEAYLQYVANLRAVGCPEERVRHIIVADVNELFDKKRLQDAITNDLPWWRAESYMGTFGVVIPQTGVPNHFEEERRALFTRLLGANWDETMKIPPLSSGGVRLTGPVLGALNAEAYNTAQEVCARSMERHQSYYMAQINGGQPMDTVELARMRNQTRTDLAKIFTPEEMEEFLLRYSHNSQQLRQNLRGFEATPEEFRKIFRAIDLVDHPVQMNYGGPEALSPKQREEHERQRDQAVQEMLPAGRYQAYLQMKDPLYRQAQTMAQQYGMNAKAVTSLYQLNQSQQQRQQAIAANGALTAEQKSQAMQALMHEQQQSMQRILTDVNYRR